VAGGELFSHRLNTDLHGFGGEKRQISSSNLQRMSKFQSSNFKDWEQKGAQKWIAV
jgi:hypothetical protein